MTRIFLPPEIFTSENLVITGDQARHLSLVLRVRPGDTFIALDGNGHKYNCSIISAHKKEIKAEIVSKSSYSAESPVSITLAQGIPKGDKMDLIIQKATELGVKKIIPLITERVEVRHTGKVARWNKIAHAASEQSGRDIMPDVSEPVSLDEFLSRQISPSARGYINDIKGVELESHIGIIFSAHQREKGLRWILTGLKNMRHATIIVGPEGGFSKEEVNAAIEKGFIEASLGPRILRTETAPIAAISIIQYELGDAG